MMKKRKSLERAVILGLLLSTSVYGSAWAENILPTITENSEIESMYSGNITVQGNADNSAIEITNKNIEINTEKNDNEDGTITLNSQKFGVNLKGEGTVSLNASGDIVVTIIKPEEMGPNDPVPMGIRVEEGSVGSITFDAQGSNRINVEGNGVAAIFTNEQNNANLTFISQTANNEFTGTSGLVNHRGTGTIELTANNGGNILNTTSGTTVAIDHDSIINITGGFNEIKTDDVIYGNAIKVTSPGEVSVTATKNDNIITGGISVNAGGEIIIKAEADEGSNIITSTNNTVVNIGGYNESLNSNIYIYAGKDNIIEDTGIDSQAIHSEPSGYFEVIAQNGNNRITGTSLAVLVNTKDNTISAGTDNIITGGNLESKIGSGINSTNGGLNIIAGNNNIITGGMSGIVGNQNDIITVTSTKGDNIVSGLNNSYGNGILSQNTSYITLNAGTNNVVSSGATGIYSYNGSSVDLNAEAGSNKVQSTSGTAIISYGENSSVTMLGQDNQINSGNTGIWGVDKGKIELTATTSNNQIITNLYGIYSDSYSDVDLTGVNNIIYAGDTTNGYGSYYAIYAKSQGDVDLISNGGTNRLLGAVYASGNVIDGDTKTITDVTLQGNNNVVLSNAYIANAGGLTDKKVISALYAQNGAGIKLDGDVNLLGTYADSSSDDLERVVWAYDTADISIDGATAISTDSYDKATNSKDIAIAAGTATGLDELGAEAIKNYTGDRAVVNVNYNDFVEGGKSSITGDILAAYAGEVNITAGAVTARAASGAGINITGNLLAGNNGILNVDLGNGGVLNGRADDYGDAGVVTNGHGSEYFNPAFSSAVYSGGQVNLTMGDNSRWNVTGQSWITSIKTSDAEETAENNHIIDLVHTNTDLNNKAHALTVYEFDGNATFNMSLAADRDVSDMLYIKNADGSYVVNVANAVTYDDMYADRGDGNVFDGLRFATVGEGSNATFRAITYDGGINNVEYLVDTDSYDGNEENEHYNGNDLNEYKPGDNTIDEFFKNEGTPGAEAATNNIMMLAAENDAAADGTVDSVTGANEVTNFKLVGVKSTDLSDGGKTVLNMSRANYSNAIYMDRLNKRLGEARYINGEEDQGMWVRIRHDRIGKTDAYRSQNTMYELGYDEKQECDNGMRRVGFAIDYMHGDTGYNDIAGKGEIDRYGLWLYDTWMGDKGHYADYVAKWGHLKNDFGIYAPTTGKEITGDYSNNVFSISAEYGRKKDIGSDWYFEPQAQLQLARVTGADYVTSQGTKVSVDGINSLIGRAGFRLGKDFGEEKQSTVYIKADVLHEFLGDQDIRALDATTNGNWSTISYENEGTWYDVGVGFAAMMSKNSYAFLDLEKSFGHDNDETYQINAGMQWTF